MVTVIFSESFIEVTWLKMPLQNLIKELFKNSTANEAFETQKI